MTSGSSQSINRPKLCLINTIGSRYSRCCHLDCCTPDCSVSASAAARMRIKKRWGNPLLKGQACNSRQSSLSSNLNVNRKKKRIQSCPIDMSYNDPNSPINQISGHEDRCDRGHMSLSDSPDNHRPFAEDRQRPRRHDRPVDPVTFQIEAMTPPRASSAPIIR